MKIEHSEDYRKLRASKYPSLGNQLDAILKLAISLKNQGFELPVETNNWVLECLQVKALYKKPDQI